VGVRRQVKKRRPLAARVAVVAGATRGAGRGIARALAEAGAMVYCTGRSMRGQPSPYNRPETVDQTADMITLAGGSAVAVRVDHTIEPEVEALFSRVDREQGRLDVLVNSIAGEDPLIAQSGWFWTTDLANGEAGLRQGLLSHIITAKHAAAMMIPRKRGLIVEVTEADIFGGGGNPVSQSIKLALKGMAMNMAAELAPHGVAAVAITPGFLRSEAMLEHFGVTEETWRDGGKKDSNFLESESPLFVGRAVAALAADPRIMEHTGQLLSSWEVGREYRLTDVDGRRPDWGAHDIDFSVLPESFVDYFRAGTKIQLEWLDRVRARTKRFMTQLPRARAAAGTRSRRTSRR
jgi:NAD(P)-dependent dehydrogenase (short-subunit alcohol dehydrogenase family)